MKKEALEFCLYLTNAKNQLELAKMTNIISTNASALNNSFYNDYSDMLSKARSISAKQVNNIYPQMKQRRNQKDINNAVNMTVQSVLLNKDSIENSLNKLVKMLDDVEE
jgi:putative chitobiose transport system substrate-binding protein